MEQAAASDEDRDAAELDERARQVGVKDACLIIYTSGTTGRPKGVVLTNQGFAAARRNAVEMNLFGPGALVYLYLPLAHVFAQLVQAMAFEIGAPIAYWGGDPTRDRRRVGRREARRPAVGAADLREGVRRGNGDDSGRRPGRGGGSDRARQPRARRPPCRRRGVRRRMPPRSKRRTPSCSRSSVASSVATSTGHLRSGADRPRDPPLLLRLRRSRDGGLGNDGDDRYRYRSIFRRPTVSGRSAGRCAPPTFASQTTARSRSPATSCSASTGTTRRRRPKRSRPTAISRPGTWGRSTAMASCRSPVARRTSSSPPAARI